MLLIVELVPYRLSSPRKPEDERETLSEERDPSGEPSDEPDNVYVISHINQQRSRIRQKRLII